MPARYHADVIGSLMRPRYLREARAALDAGQLQPPEFKRIEDRAVDQAGLSRRAQARTRPPSRRRPDSAPSCGPGTPR
jgi:hypothetical protein